MAMYKFNQPITINGETRWITARTLSQEYAWNWVQTYSVPNAETRAATTCKRKIRLYLVPAFERPAV